MDIEKSLFPDSGKLRDDYTATIVDLGLDPVECSFNGVGSVEIDTSGYTHIAFDKHHLNMLLGFIRKAEKMFENESEIDQ